NGATLRVAGGINLAESALTLFGTLQNFGQTNLMVAAITLGSSNSIATVASGSQLTLSGAIGGSGGLLKSGVGVLQFSGSSSNTFSGGTFVSQGTLVLNKSSAEAIPGPLAV